MKIFLSPVRSDAQLFVSVKKNTISINDTQFDFNSINEGDKIPVSEVGSKWIVSDVIRINGEIQLTLILPHGAKPPKETLFPKPIIVQTDGVIHLPEPNLPSAIEVDDE